LIFAIGLHKKDISILQRIQATLGVGKIHIHGKDSVQSVRRYHSLTNLPASSVLPDRLDP